MSLLLLIFHKQEKERKNMKIAILLQQEKGSALIVSILTLIVLSLGGIMAMKTTTIETQVSTNLISYKNSFYKAESAVREIALSIQNTPDNNLITSNTLLLPNGTNLPALTNAGNLIDPQSTLDFRKQIVNDPLTNITQTEPIHNSNVLVVHGGIASGSSMSIGHSHTTPSKHRFFVYGNARGGTTLGRGVLIEVGYLKRIRL